MSCTQFLCHFCSQLSSKIARVPEVCDSSRSRLSKRKAGCDVTKAALEPGARMAVLDQRQVPSMSYPLLRDCEGRHVLPSTPKSSTSTVMAEEGYTSKSQVIFTCHQRRGKMISPRNPAGYGKQPLPRKNRCLWAALRLVRH